MADDTLLVDDDDGLRTITINRPEVKNALTAAMRTQLCELVEAADADAGTWAVIVTAVDPVFSAGVDFREAATGTGAGGARNPGEALRAMATPIVCAVNGACVTGGLEIALSCTFVVASTAPASPTPTPASTSWPVGAHRAAAPRGRAPQGGRDVDHRQLRRRR